MYVQSSSSPTQHSTAHGAARRGAADGGWFAAEAWRRDAVGPGEGRASQGTEPERRVKSGSERERGRGRGRESETGGREGEQAANVRLNREEKKKKRKKVCKAGSAM